MRINFAVKATKGHSLMLEERKQVMSSVIPVSTLQDQLSQTEKCGDCYPDGVERLPVQEELPNRESVSAFQGTV